MTADARIVVLTGASGVSPFAATDGSQLWRTEQIHVPAMVTPAIGDGVVLLPQSDG